MAKKLPDNIFADSPLRATSDDKPKLAAPDAPTLPPPAVALAPEPAPALAPVTTRREKASASSPAAAPVELVKQTIYLPLDLVHAIEDEVFDRKRAGERGLSVAELHRSIVHEWAARRARRARTSSVG